MLPVARLGDRVTCNLHPIGSQTISAGGQSKVDGRPVARVGDKITCGCTISEGSSRAKDGGKPIAYLGCSTSGGGRITQGSETAKVKP